MLQNNSRRNASVGLCLMGQPEVGQDRSVLGFACTPLLQKKSAETAVARSSRSFGGPGPHVFNFTCSATTGKAKNAPVLASKARLKRFADFFCNNGVQ